MKLPQFGSIPLVKILIAYLDCIAERMLLKFKYLYQTSNPSSEAQLSFSLSPTNEDSSKDAQYVLSCYQQP